MTKEVLTKPSANLAGKVMREVNWQERFEGEIFEPGPGSVTERLFKIVEVHNLLKGMPSFNVDYDVLARWVGETLGDAELAENIRSAANQCKEEMAHWKEHPKTPDAGTDGSGGDAQMVDELPQLRLRRQVHELLGLRIAQCREALGLSQTA
jgi:hypothetical protein